MVFFVFGVVSIALLMGFMVGASSSPVAGTAITASFGIVAAAFAYAQQSAIGDPDGIGSAKPDKSAKARQISIDTLNSLGKVLFAFSATFAIGMAAGIWARAGASVSAASTSFPWGNAAPPQSPRAAIDWLLVQRNLRNMGYTEDQIGTLYKLGAAMKKDEPLIPTSELLSPLFSSQKPEVQPFRYLANQPPSSPNLFNKPFDILTPQSTSKGEIG